MKIVSGGIQHETNTFARGQTTTADFIRHSQLGTDLAGGGAIVERYGGTATVHGGYLAGAAEARFELVPVMNARAQPSGLVEQASFDHLLELLVSRIADELPADGILLDLHGAMVAAAHEDAEGEIVRRVRAIAGPDVPVVVTLDLHANISPALATRATVIIGYDTYPHVDMAERGREAALLMGGLVRGDVQPVQAYRQLPLATMPPMQCTLREPMRTSMDELHELEASPGIVTATLAMGFPFADIHDMGVSVLVTADGNPELAEAGAAELAANLWQRRDQLQPQLTPIGEAMRLARGSDSGTVIFADGSDNPGGGAPCDGTVALQAMVEAGFEGGLVGLMYDPETVSQAMDRGVGQRFEAVIGGKTDDRHGPPVRAAADVVALSDGGFEYGGPMSRGLKDTLGDTALLRVGGVEVVVCSQRRQLLDRAMLATVGIDAAARRLLVVKSAVHFRADFGPIASAIVDGDTPGIHRPDFDCFDYERVRRPLYPLDAQAQPPGTLSPG